MIDSIFTVIQETANYVNSTIVVDDGTVDGRAFDLTIIAFSRPDGTVAFTLNDTSTDTLLGAGFDQSDITDIQLGDFSGTDNFNRTFV